ncbi:hypothetical protein J6590_001354 [Homalodisca vitripennis]|nr:hypothetical protein J6590_001354 [Homalodisca vitripennis]
MNDRVTDCGVLFEHSSFVNERAAFSTHCWNCELTVADCHSSSVLSSQPPPQIFIKFYTESNIKDYNRKNGILRWINFKTLGSSHQELSHRRRHKLTDCPFTPKSIEKWYSSLDKFQDSRIFLSRVYPTDGDTNGRTALSHQNQ